MTLFITDNSAPPVEGGGLDRAVVSLRTILRLGGHGGGGGCGREEVEWTGKRTELDL